jgi:1-phosphofructokinase
MFAHRQFGPVLAGYVRWMRAMVFAPAPQLTVTVERAGDGGDELHVHPGGQGIWQARMLRLFDVPVTLCAALGGEVGTVLEPALEREDLTLRTVHREGSSGWYVHDRRDGTRDEVAGAHGSPLRRHEIDELYGLALAEGLKADVSVLSGTQDPTLVPADLYRRLTADIGANGGRVVADLAGGQLAAALEGGLAFLKVSHEEVLADGRAADDSEREMVRALYRLRDDGAAAVVISRADQPALALLDDDVFAIEVPRLETADTRGAGDSMTAGVAAVLAKGGTLTDAVRTGAAAGALNVTRHGLGTGRAEVIAELVGRVTLNRIDAYREDA